MYYTPWHDMDVERLYEICIELTDYMLKHSQFNHGFWSWTSEKDLRHNYEHLNLENQIHDGLGNLEHVCIDKLLEELELFQVIEKNLQNTQQTYYRLTRKSRRADFLKVLLCEHLPVILKELRGHAPELQAK